MYQNAQEHFADYAKTMPNPWKTLVKKTGGWLMAEDYFNSYVVSGLYDGDSRLEGDIVYMFGLAPNITNYLDCFFGTQHETEKIINRRRLARLASTFAPKLAAMDVAQVLCVGGVIHQMLGVTEYHTIGLLGLHRALPGQQEVGSLWVNNRLPRDLVERLLKDLLAKYL